ncbi:hypothetical protein V8J88_12100 [Massilia sp. W12]|uniref:hypothetical protein n=1 Tax=Massilia sp. W12 TaxID=3126507 RepID=UPI0030D2CEA2
MIYELRCADLNSFAPLVPSPGQNLLNVKLFFDGKPLQWPILPKVQKYYDKKRKIQKDRADIGIFIPGSITLTNKAYIALSDFLKQFGELVQLECENGEAWLYNVTNLIACVDFEKSEKSGNIIRIENFYEDNIPNTPAIFKDVHTVRTRIYLNVEAKMILEKLQMEHSLTGLDIRQAGISEFY